MKKLIPLLVLFLIGFSNKNYANHFAGAEITYKATATPGIVEIHFVLFQLCDGPPIFCTAGCGAACTQTLQIKGADPTCSTNTFGTCTVSLVSVRDVSNNLADGVKSNCTNLGCATPGTYTPGLERLEFVGTANIGATSGIPAGCCNVRFTWTLSSRSQTISTVSGSPDFYNDVTINRCQYNSQPSSSPVGMNDPLLLTCSGRSVVYNMGAMNDPNGDSLSYALVPCLQAYNSWVGYIPPWSATRPLPYSGSPNAPFPLGFHIDSSTGVVSFTPGASFTNNFVGIICVEVKQWRNVNGVPVVIGITRRDVMVTILANCIPNNNPTLLTYPSNASKPDEPQTDWVFPSGQQTCFTMAAKDTDYLPPAVLDTTRIDTTNSFTGRGGTFTRLSLPGSYRDSMRFCWTPTLAQESAKPYVFNIRVRDSRKPIDGKTDYGFKISVPPLPRISVTGIMDSARTCNYWDFSYALQPGSPAVSETRWSIYKLLPGNATSLTYTVTSPGTYNLTNRLLQDSGRYLIKLDVGNLSNSYTYNTYTDTIAVAKNALRIVGSDTTVCPITTVTLHSSVSGSVGSRVVTWQDNSLLYTGVSRTTSSGKTNRWLVVSVQDSINCKASDTVLVNVSIPPLMISSLADTTQCERNNTFKLVNSSTKVGFAGNLYKWLLDDSVLFVSDTVQFSLSGPGAHKLRLICYAPQGCSDTLSKNLLLRSAPKAKFTVNDSTQCLSGNTFTFSGQSSNPDGAMSYLWTTTSGSSTSLNYSKSYASIGVQKVKLVVSNNLLTTCKDSLEKNVYVYASKPQLNFSASYPSWCLNGNRYVFTNTTPPVADSSQRFVWFIENDTFTAPVVVKSFATEGTKFVKLRMYSLGGCDDSITRSYSIFAAPKAAFSMSDSVKCIRGNVFVFTNTTQGLPYSKFVIDGSLPDTNKVVTRSFSTVGVKTITLITGVAGCFDTLNKHVEVLFSPTATFTLSDTAVCKHAPIVLTNTSSNAVPLKTLWMFSDNTFDSAVVVAKRFGNSGKQRASLKVTTDKQCTDTVSRAITVLASPATPIISGPTSCLPDSAAAYSVVVNPAVTYQWNIDNGRFVSPRSDSSSVVVKWNTTSAYGRIFVSAKNADGCASDTTRFDVSIIGGVGLNQVAASFHNLLVFPNPTTDAITVSLSSLSAQRIQITVYNIVGTQVKAATYDSPKGIFTEQINLHDLQKGMYLMHIEGETGSQVVKLMLR